jgi:hypothetical protein
MDSRQLAPPYALDVKDPPAPHHMLACIADVCREAREASGLELIDIVGYTRADRPVLRRFESLESQPGRLDEIVAGYEVACGIEPVGLWLRAVELKRERMAAAASA